MKGDLHTNLAFSFFYAHEGSYSHRIVTTELDRTSPHRQATQSSTFLDLQDPNKLALSNCRIILLVDILWESTRCEETSRHDDKMTWLLPHVATRLVAVSTEFMSSA